VHSAVSWCLIALQQHVQHRCTTTTHTAKWHVKLVTLNLLNMANNSLQARGSRKVSIANVGEGFTEHAGPGGFKVYLWAKREGANIRIFTDPLPVQNQEW
jgi:hypothetical protein